MTRAPLVAAPGCDGVPDDLFSARESLRAELGWRGPVAVSLGDLVPSAGTDLLVQVAAICRYSQPGLRWVVMGEGELLAPLQRLAAELGVVDWVEFAGLLPDVEVRKRLVAADLFLLPTRVRGDGMAALEANACGLPVVATPVGANVEIIRSLPAPNRLATVATPEALATAVDGLLLLETDAAMDVEAMRQELRTAALRHDQARHDVYSLEQRQGIGA